MIKRILVALDVDADTPVATRYAQAIAGTYGAEVTGLAVVDTGQIDAGARGGGIGSMYYAEKLRENLTRETREKAQELIRAFEDALMSSGIEHAVAVKEGVPFRRILEDAKFHDVVLVGREPHFFYGHPKERTATLGRVVKESTPPTIVVGQEFETVERVLIAYDGSAASARTAQYFIHLLPFGKDFLTEALHIHDGDAESSELMLKHLKEYYGKHGLSLKTTSMRGDAPASLITEYAVNMDASLVVAGAHSVSKIRKWTFGSTTTALLEGCPKPMFLYH